MSVDSESLSEDATAPIVGLALEGDAVSCSLKSEVESSHAAEKRADIHAASK